MFRTNLTASIATVALIAATPALAAPGGGGGMGLGAGGGIGASVRAGVAVNTDIGVTVRDTARVQSQGSAKANARAQERANENSALSNDLSSETMTGSRIPTRLLQSDSSTDISSRGQSRISASANTRTQLGAQVTPGTSISDSSGTTIGTVTGIRTTGNGAVKSVQVTLDSGQVIDVSGRSLSLNGDVLTTNTLTSNINGQRAASLSTSLSGVTSGMSVVDSGGATIGTVTGIRTVGNGSVNSVQVTLTDGTIINLGPNSLSLDGDVLTTSSLTSNVNSQGAANASINGLIHASPRSALALAGVTTLTGLDAGLTVNGSGGSAIGTVSSILTNRSGAVVGITVDLDAGGTVTIPATTLSMNGDIVDTTFLP